MAATKSIYKADFPSFCEPCCV